MAARGRATRCVLVSLVVAVGLLAGCSGGAGPDFGGRETNNAPATSPQQMSPAPSAGYDNDPVWPELREDATAARRLVEGYWAGAMPAMFGRQFLPVARFLPYQGAMGAPSCGGSRLPARNASYCFGENFVAFDVDWFLENMKSEAGDGSVYVILFHEWGHAVQDRIGRPSLPISGELQADCYAGAALAGVVQGGQLQLEAGDPEEVVGILYRAGDPAGTPWLDPAAHGSPAQRIQAFVLGQDQGPAACYGSYR